MSTHLYVSPAASGKTTYALTCARESAKGLESIPRVVVPTHLQARAWRRRLAELGGTIGVRLMTFDQLHTECLNQAGEIFTELDDPVQYRLIRAIVDNAPLNHYKPLKDRPGFIQVLQGLLGELKAARIWPRDFVRAITELGNEPRLAELAQVYTVYQEHLQKQNWADRAGIAWLAVESLEERATNGARDWPLLVVDGFDNFTEVQIALLKTLSGRVGEMIITLTGSMDEDRQLVHRRFNKTRKRLEEALQTKAERLPEYHTCAKRALVHLEANLYKNEAQCLDCNGSVELIEAPDRAAEVRTALRWLKERVVSDGFQPGEVALLARSIAPYRPYILQTASEFGLPIRLVDGIPLRSSPVIAAILDLLRLMLPRPADAQPGLPLRLVVEAWRSPYFDWSASPSDGETVPIGIDRGDADLLDRAAHWGRVIGGQAQWEQVLGALAAISKDDRGDEERDLPGNLPIGKAAELLLDKFHRFTERLTPPAEANRYRDFVSWLETIIGPDPSQSKRFKSATEPTSLQVVARCRTAEPQVADQDIASLQVLKDVFRGLVWAEQAVADNKPVDLALFFTDLVGAIDATTYRLPIRPDHEEILVTHVIQARGVAFRAVAVLGLAEGEFPATINEDPFLRDEDRLRLRKDFKFAIDSSIESAEIEYFYETITRPWERMLLTRPRLADNGASWQASPYWEEVRRLLSLKPQSLPSGEIPQFAQAASWPELVESLGQYVSGDSVWLWAQQHDVERLASLNTSTRLFRSRETSEPSPFDGDLGALATDFAHRFAPDHSWSASRLEKYRTCPYFFFVGGVLGLEPREVPVEGLDRRQLGNIYHRIFKQVYEAPGVSQPPDLEQLVAALDSVAQDILDKAPKKEGFRETAWWKQTRLEIVENVRHSLRALSELSKEFAPVVPNGLEVSFWGSQELVIRENQDSFRVHGIIDRIDRDAGGNVRIIDYKTSGPSSYKAKAIIEGKTLQVPLYALAAQVALKLGKITEGFYWHVIQAESSEFQLSEFDGGPEAAMAIAVEKSWEAVRGARRAYFVPKSPDDGCPDYCPAATFCWHFRPGFRGKP